MPRPRQRFTSLPPSPSQPKRRPHVGFGPADWVAALRDFKLEPPASRQAGSPAFLNGWWEAAFDRPPTSSEESGHPCGETEMLMVVAYDISDPERLRQVAHHCEDYGVRVQYSVFECRLELEEFQQFWDELTALIDPKTDRLVAYRVCARCAREIQTAGTQFVTSSAKQTVYVF